MRIRHLMIDFDGTCTRVQDAADDYLKECHRIFAQEVGEEVAKEWASALDTVRSHSPHAGWMLGGAPSAPAAADPYILAGEAAGYLIMKYKIRKPAPDFHAMAYDAAQAPFREELAEVLEGLVGLGVRVSFVSNARTRKIENRLSDLLVKNPTLRHALTVQGDAAKFRIQELSFDADVQPPEDLRRLFDALPGSTNVEPLERPIYLRRGAYFEALCKVWENDPSRPASTLVCGDIWELDLAMPAALGAHVHLITRAAPYDTYEYERHAVEGHGARGSISDDLRGLLERVRELKAAS